MKPANRKAHHTALLLRVGMALSSQKQKVTVNPRNILPIHDGSYRRGLHPTLMHCYPHL